MILEIVLIVACFIATKMSLEPYPHLFDITEKLAVFIFWCCIFSCVYGVLNELRRCHNLEKQYRIEKTNYYRTHKKNPNATV